jgi:hypothetical protein
MRRDAMDEIWTVGDRSLRVQKDFDRGRVDGEEAEGSLREALWRGHRGEIL